MEPKQPAGTGMPVFYVKYKKILTFLCVFLLMIGLPSKIYNITPYDQAHKYEFIGSLLDTIFMFLIVPLWLLINVRKANKAYKNENEWKKV